VARNFTALVVDLSPYRERHDLIDRVQPTLAVVDHRRFEDAVRSRGSISTVQRVVGHADLVGRRNLS
jgi:hypothetical protein